MNRAIAILALSAVAMGAAPVERPPRATLTCIDLCTGKQISMQVEHPNTPQLYVGEDGFCLTGVQAKTCVHGENRRLLDHPVRWTGGIWKTWGWWGI